MLFKLAPDFTHRNEKGVKLPNFCHSALQGPQGSWLRIKLMLMNLEVFYSWKARLKKNKLRQRCYKGQHGVDAVFVLPV